MRGRIKVAATLACFLSFLLIYGITSRADLQVSDEVAVFASAISLESKGDLAIDDLYWLHERTRLNLGEAGRGQHLYSKYFPGNVISSAVIYHLAKKVPDLAYFWKAFEEMEPPTSHMKLANSNTGARAAMRLNAFLGALGLAGLLILMLRYFDWKASLLSVVLFGLCSDWWYQSRGYLSEVGAGAFLIASLCATGYGKPFQSGIFLGVSLLFRPTNILAMPIWAKSIMDRKGVAIWSGLGILGGILGLLLYNQLRFGSILVFGYGKERFAPTILIGLFINLLSPGRSVFVYSPILLLAVPGAWLFWKRNRSLACIAILAVISHLLLVSAWYVADGGWTWGSRLMTPVLPILGFLMVPAMEQAWKKRGELLVVLVLAILGFAIQTVALARNPLLTLVDRVVYKDIPYYSTVYSPRHAWVVLQTQYLEYWQVCDLDSYTLRQWFGKCPAQEISATEIGAP